MIKIKRHLENRNKLFIYTIHKGKIIQPTAVIQLYPDAWSKKGLLYLFNPWGGVSKSAFWRDVRWSIKHKKWERITKR